MQTKYQNKDKGCEEISRQDTDLGNLQKWRKVVAKKKQTSKCVKNLEAWRKCLIQKVAVLNLLFVSKLIK